MTDGWTRITRVGRFSPPLESFVAAAHADGTLGEIAGVLREEFGKYKEPKTL